MADSDSPYVARFQSAAFHTNLKGASDLTESIIGRGIALPGLTRVAHGIAKAIAALLEVDIPLVSQGAINDLNGQSQNLFAQLNAFNSTSNQNNLNAANDVLDSQVLPSIVRLPTVRTATDASVIFAAVDEERRRLLSKFDELQLATAALADTTQKVMADRARLDGEIQKRDERLNDITKRIDDVINQFNSRSTEAERARDLKYTETSAALTKSVTDLQTQTKEAYAKQESDLKNSSKKILEELVHYRDEAKQLLQVIGDTSVSAPFDNSARQDRRVAFWFRLAAGALFVAMVCIVAFTMWGLTNPKVGAASAGLPIWELLLVRFMTSLICGVPAYYFAREAAKFQYSADRNRSIQLELASIGPFIEGLDPAKRSALREELTRRYFKADAVVRDVEKPFDPNRFADVAIEAIKALKRP